VRIHSGKKKTKNCQKIKKGEKRNLRSGRRREKYCKCNHPHEIIIKKKLYKTETKINNRTTCKKKTAFFVVHFLANRGQAQAPTCQTHRERD
jgi:hypothetical protein